MNKDTVAESNLPSPSRGLGGRYLIATRPWSFPVSTFSVLVTAAGLYYLGYSYFPGATAFWLRALWATVGIVLFHAAGNIWSDYFDYKRGVDREDTFGAKTITSGDLTPREDFVWGIVLLVLACVNGIAMWWVSGNELLIYGGLGALFSLVYPWMKYHALGDLDILIEYGIIPALGTSYFLTGETQWTALWFVPAFVPITIAVLHANNTRDAKPDGRAKIKTFAMLIGRKASIVVYHIEVLFPILWVVVLCCLGKMPWLSLLVIASLKKALENCKMMRAFATDEHAIDRLDEFTSMHQMLNSLILILTMVIATLIMTMAL